MQLLPEIFSTFATGCDSWQIHEGAWRPHRLPAAMRPLYENGEGSRTRMLCTSGVRLRFISNTTKVWIHLRYGVRARQVFKSSLIVDGQPAGSFGPDEFAPDWQGVIFEHATAQSRAFDIWLPHLSQADVVALELDDGCNVQPALPLPIRWLAYGDSITQGMTSTLPTSCAVGLAALICKAEVINVGIGGAKLIRELATAVPTGKFDVISIAYGTNDFNQLVSVEEFVTNTKALIRVLADKHPQTPVLLITPLIWVGRTGVNRAGVTLTDYRKALESTDAGPMVRVVDGTKLVPDDGKMFVDDVHPNDAGFAIYGKALAAQINAVLGAA